MKKKGFTLVEIIGVITLLGVIALIAFPSVTKTLNNSREKAYLEQVRKIERAALQYGIETNGVFPDEDSSEIKIIQLNEIINSGYIQLPESKTIINPMTKEEMQGCVLTQYNPLRKQHVVHYSENCDKTTTISPITNEVTVNYGDNISISTYFQTTDDSAVICPINSTKDLSVAKHTITCQTEADSGLVFNSNITIKVNPKISAVVYYNPVTGTTCNDYVEENSITGVKDGCMKWYAYKIDGNNISLLLDHNTTKSVAWVSKSDYILAGGTESDYNGYGNHTLGPITLMKQLERDTINWIADADIIDIQDIAELTGYEETNGTPWVNTSSNFHFETNTNQMSAACTFDEENYSAINVSGCRYSWLYDRLVDNCTGYTGCFHKYDNNKAKAYWAKNIIDGAPAYAHHIRTGRTGSNYVFVDETGGVRPVITVTLDNLTS